MYCSAKSKIDISDRRELSRIFSNQSFDGVVNLAAQAGVRYSIENPYVYVDSNSVINGQKYYYAVTAYDKGYDDPKIFG